MAPEPWTTRRSGRHRRQRGEEGSTLLLVPVGVLILVVLGAIAVDFAVIYTAQREVANLAAGLANDAAGAVDEAAFFADGEHRIDGGRAARVVRTVTAARADDAIDVSCRPPTLATPTVVRVACVGTVELIFSAALPGGVSTYTVRAASTARAVEARWVP